MEIYDTKSGESENRRVYKSASPSSAKPGLTASQEVELTNLAENDAA